MNREHSDWDVSILIQNIFRALIECVKVSFVIEIRWIQISTAPLCQIKLNSSNVEFILSISCL